MSTRLLKGVAVVFGAIGVSALGLFASDGLRGIDTDLVALTGSSSAVCPQGMVEAKYQGNSLCIDMYEASPSDGCPHLDPRNTIETETNVSDTECYAASVPKASPWRFVSLPQAQRLCAEAGKRLPSSAEWYRVALGTEQGSCVVDRSAPAQTGTSDCVSAAGVYDMVGNLWEWTNEQVNGNTFDGRTLPAEGYVDEVDVSGVALQTKDEANALYGADYFWSKEEGIFGMIRGGFYGSGDDAGLYTINAAVSTSFASQGVGFRCVKDA